jgi:hypothetical protein
MAAPCGHTVCCSRRVTIAQRGRTVRAAAGASRSREMCTPRAVHTQQSPSPALLAEDRAKAAAQCVANPRHEHSGCSRSAAALPAALVNGCAARPLCVPPPARRDRARYARCVPAAFRRRPPQPRWWSAAAQCVSPLARHGRDRAGPTGSVPSGALRHRPPQRLGTFKFRQRPCSAPPQARRVRARYARNRRPRSANTLPGHAGGGAHDMPSRSRCRARCSLAPPNGEARRCRSPPSPPRPAPRRAGGTLRLLTACPAQP